MHPPPLRPVNPDDTGRHSLVDPYERVETHLNNIERKLDEEIRLSRAFRERTAERVTALERDVMHATRYRSKPTMPAESKK